MGLNFRVHLQLEGAGQASCSSVEAEECCSIHILRVAGLMRTVVMKECVEGPIQPLQSPGQEGSAEDSGIFHFHPLRVPGAVADGKIQGCSCT